MIKEDITKVISILFFEIQLLIIIIIIKNVEGTIVRVL